ncbi:MAG: holo-ACP synthase [Defluviitaleaceae bacterium]|nr:holo-ACP synthase [Defluviitaleaceae bacterium]
MIISIGTDIVEVVRVKKAVSRLRFRDKCFTDAEILYCSSKKSTAFQSMAGLFAAKEAVSKAIGNGFRGFLPRDIEIVHDALGAPSVRLAKAVILPNDSNVKIMISISHEKNYATATAIICKVC